ncbi:MAG: hypothetical protein QOG71_2230 [Pyrinomonadaceae bacterium]|nr:hypothetical protein [Pyrinomonadaceae bacterium]
MPVSPEQSENSIRLQYITKYIQERIDEELLNGNYKYITIEFSKCPVEFSVLDVGDELEEKLRKVYKKAGWRNLHFQMNSHFFTQSFNIYLAK